ncbi:hypothetical protein F5Y05DRAFT_410655 [Hypoxylon sp. FL0543]|nr:hypothetical protein F5Y05DRAFT_410655 [Hypoxylon sp. FL0543]
MAASQPARFVNKRANFSSVAGQTASPPPMENSAPYSRPMGALETFFKKLSDAGAPANREHAAFFTVLQVRFPSCITDVEAYIARAWEVIMRRFPELRGEVSPPDEADPHNRPRITVRPFAEYCYRDTFSVHPECPNVDVLFSSPCQRKTASCCWLPGPGQVVLRTSHWRTDGLGLILMSDVFMSTLATVVQLGLGAPLSRYFTQKPLEPPFGPSLEDVIRNYMQYPPCDAEDAANADDLVDTFVNGGRSIALPTRPGSDAALPSAGARAALRMTAASTAELARACHAQGVSVTSALNAAIIRATTRYPQDPDADSYVLFAPIDLRGPLIAAGAQECMQPTGTFVSGLPMRIDGVVKRSENGDSVPAKSFDDLARELSAYYSQDALNYRQPGDPNAKTVNFLQLAEPYMERMTKLFSKFPLPGCPHPKTPVISSLGKMDELLKREYPSGDDGVNVAPKVLVTDFWVGVDNSTPMITFHPWSWGAELTVAAAWNDSFYSTEIAVDMLRKTLEELGEGLQIGKLSYRIVTSCYDASTQVKGLSADALARDGASRSHTPHPLNINDHDTAVSS